MGWKTDVWDLVSYANFVQSRWSTFWSAPGMSRLVRLMKVHYVRTRLHLCRLQCPMSETTEILPVVEPVFVLLKLKDGEFSHIDQHQ